MEFPYITASLAAFLMILQQLLMLSVGIYRTKIKVGIGIADDPYLEQKIRRHGNLAENSALFLVVLGVTELMAVSGSAVFWFAIFFALVRVSHALGFSHLDGAQGNIKGNKLFLVLRVLGAMGTGWGGLALGGYLAYQLLSQ